MTIKSNHSSWELFSILKISVSPDSFVQNIGNHYKEILTGTAFIIVKPEYGRNFLKTVFYHGKYDNLLSQLKSILKSSDPHTDFEKENIFSLKNDQNRPDFLFYFGQDILKTHDQIKDEFDICNAYYRVISNCFYQGQKDNHDKCADLISHIAHDVNSLLTLIDKSLINDQLAAKAVYLEQLMPQMLLLIRDMELIYVTVDVDDLLAGIIDAHPNSSQINLKSFDGNYNISCDIELMNQAFSAVFDNAIQFSDDLNNKIYISVQILDTIPLYFNKPFMQIKIADSGIGIPDEYIPLVFKPFFTTQKSTGHAGFGLSIAQKIIYAHGGYINISSDTDKGCCVSILLPIETT
jgi:hypothetical protein